MNKFVLKEITNSDFIQELTQIGFDESYKYVACDKFIYKNIKIFNLSLAQANILKQTALTFGADCAVNKNVVTGNCERTDAILCGSFSQLKKIANKIKKQPFEMSELGKEIINLLVKNSERTTKIAGILNITPDSFSDGGLYFDIKSAQSHFIKLIEDGADCIDIGAETTKPYSLPTPCNEQIERLKPILEFVKKENISIPISIDTRSAEVADFVLNNGVTTINDVSGFDFDTNMIKVISKHSASVIIQHSKGTPENMQDNPIYNNVVEDIFLHLYKKICLAKENGIDNIIIDPGICFGKTREDNFFILNHIEELFLLGCPVMVGLSRKSLLGVVTQDNDLKDSFSLALSYPLIQKGVDYLRVHNVKLHTQFLESVKSIPN